ncbi:hypothetical protein [Nocardioides sp.]|uniref:hypothetical protein n=1 Tax=Nocardioides sp. TaxID=35761 RepID=UPI00271C4174|nr:hypothetical protein [Nocardioides sp.]MDO9457972.1 hypothetical protein [Nocardioides sp.]
MSFTLLPTIVPWAIGFAAVALLGLVLTVVAVVDLARTHQRAVVASPVQTGAATGRPVRRASTRLHHA